MYNLQTKKLNFCFMSHVEPPPRRPPEAGLQARK